MTVSDPSSAVPDPRPGDPPPGPKADTSLLLLVGILAAGLIWQAWRWMAPQPPPEPAPQTQTQPAPQPQTQTPDDASADDAAVRVVIDYVRASIDAAQTGSPEALTPWLDPTSPMTERIAAEFQRRRTIGERRVVLLDRFQVERATIMSETTAVVHTIEQWRWEVRSVDGVRRYRSMARYRYELRRDAATRTWRVYAVQETPLLVEPLVSDVAPGTSVALTQARHPPTTTFSRRATFCGAAFSCA